MLNLSLAVSSGLDYSEYVQVRGDMCNIISRNYVIQVPATRLLGADFKPKSPDSELYIHKDSWVNAGLHLAKNITINGDYYTGYDGNTQVGTYLSTTRVGDKPGHFIDVLDGKAHIYPDYLFDARSATPTLSMGLNADMLADLSDMLSCKATDGVTLTWCDGEPHFTFRNNRTGAYLGIVTGLELDKSGVPVNVNNETKTLSADAFFAEGVISYQPPHDKQLNSALIAFFDLVRQQGADIAEVLIKSL